MYINKKCITMLNTLIHSMSSHSSAELPSSPTTSSYRYQMRLLNFPPDFPFPKFDIQMQRGWLAHHTYTLLEPRLLGINRELAEQSGNADPDDPHDPEEDDAIQFEGWTEGMLIFLCLYPIPYNSRFIQKRRAGA